MVLVGMKKELKDEDGEEIGSGEEDEDQYQAGTRRAKLAAQSVGFQEGKGPLPAGAYNPNDYSNLQVRAEVKQLFEYIARYKAPQMVLDAKLKPFILDYVPAIGEVDAFIKMPRPDGQPETLGLITLDEPALNQSKKAKLDFLMREYLKVANKGKNTTIHAIEKADKNPKEIIAWINDVAEIHKKNNLHLSHILKLCLILKNQCKSWLKKQKTYSKALNYQVTILIWVDKNIVNSHAICQIFLFILLIKIEILQSLCMFYSFYIIFRIQNKLTFQIKQ